MVLEIDGKYACGHILP